MNGLQSFGGHSFKTASRTGLRAIEGLSSPIPDLRRPSEVAGDLQLTKAEKREILASWASDVRAVPDAPALRQLDDGTVIHIDEVLEALRSLDDDAHQARSSDFIGRHAPAQRTRSLDWRKAVVRRNRPEDDDDPPPCPAMIAVPPRKPLSSGEAVDPALAVAA